jgi:hypothetical protein
LIQYPLPLSSPEMTRRACAPLSTCQLDRFEELEHLMQIVKARARRLSK